MNKKNILIIVVALMAIGFASVATNLVLNGSVTIGNSIDDFDIRFTKAVLEGIEDNALITDDGKKITYDASLSVTNSGVSELAYEITNNSPLYDAKVGVICTAKGTTIHPDLYTIDTTNTPEIIKSMTTEAGSVRISLIGETIEEIRESFECSLSLKSLEAKKTYKEELLNGADPVISGDLIPVTLSNDGTVTYADEYKEWYNYENKNWANAVILVDSPSRTYSVGETIQESDIESYFVWIPRYRYKLFNADSLDGTSEKLSESIAQTIEIEFESKITTPLTGLSNGEWLTHPAFTNFDTNGIWVGKFETGYKGATSVETAEVMSENPTNIIVKPNVYSWRSNIVGNFFKAMYNYNRDLNSHMMKNTEWGCVAYLSHSIYGINTEVRINNNSNFLTGYAANEKDGAESATNNQPYNTSIGYLASTTGNITGIYDMSGGAYEYLAAYRDNTVGSSGLTVTEINETYKGYFDIYPSNSDRATYSKRILGDATGEMGPFYQDDGLYKNNWYFDLSEFTVAPYPWIIRGGIYSYEANAGQFCIYSNTGESSDFDSSRLVLAF